MVARRELKTAAVTGLTVLSREEMGFRFCVMEIVGSHQGDVIAHLMKFLAQKVQGSNLI